MKKIYITPKSEFVSFNIEDEITNDLPISNYNNTSGDGGLDSEVTVSSDKDAVSPFD